MTVDNTVGVAIGQSAVANLVVEFRLRHGLRHLAVGLDVAVDAVDVAVGAALGLAISQSAVRLLFDRLVVERVARVAGVDKGFDTRAVARVLLHDLLVLQQSSHELLVRDIIEEHAGAEWIGHGGAKLTIARLEDGLGALVEDLVVELWVIHREASAGEEVQQTMVLLVGEQTAHVGECRRVSHIDGNGVAVAKRYLRHQLVHGRPRMSIRNDTVQHNLMQVRRLQLQHLVDARPVDLIGGLADLRACIVRAAERRADDFLAVLVEQVERRQVRTARDFDQLREAVADLRLRQVAQEAEVQERVLRRVVGSQAVLVVAVVHSDLDRDRGIDQADHRGGDANVVGVAAVGRTGEAGNICDKSAADHKNGLLAHDA